MTRSRSCLLKATIILFITFGNQGTTEARDNHLLCNKWKTDCAKYELHNCEDNSTATNTAENTSSRTSHRTNPYTTRTWDSCCELAQFATNAGSAPSSGVYNINLLGSFAQTQAYCDVSNGGWTVIQKRSINSTTSFNRTWDEYLQGFGSLDGDFWYGLRKLRWLTTETKYELSITFTKLSGEVETSQYSKFSVNGDKYTLSLEGHRGNVDYLNNFNEEPFTTYGTNNLQMKINCAEVNQSGLLGGWWYKASTCLGDKGANLNGKYGNKEIDDHSKLTIVSSEMKIRQVGCNVSRSTSTSQTTSNDESSVR